MQPPTTNEIRVVLPTRVGSREEVHSVLASVPRRLEGIRLVVDASSVRVARPSFVDELVRELLVVRGAAHVEFRGLPELARTVVTKSIRARGVASKVAIAA